MQFSNCACHSFIANELEAIGPERNPFCPYLCERMVGMQNFSFPSTFVCSAATLYQSHLSHLMSSVEYLVQCLLLASMTLFVWHCMHRYTLNVIQVMMTLMPLLTRR